MSNINVPLTIAEKKRVKAALVLAKKLEAATDAMVSFTKACVLTGERCPDADDNRRTLAASMREYAAYIQRVYQS